MLYLVATPIGNLEDITYRAVRILREVSLIAAEDTRHTRKLLSRYDIHTPLTSYHEYSSPQRVAELIDKLRLGDVALVSDAGCQVCPTPVTGWLRRPLKPASRSARFQVRRPPSPRW